jgi:hypothetical protein
MAGLLGGPVDKLVDRFGKPYATWLVNMLTSPSKIVEVTRQRKADGSQGEYLLTILLVSTLIGVAIGAIIPNRPPIQSRAIVFLVVSLLWFFLSLLVHGFCRLLGGKEDAQIGVSLMVQDLAFAYIASNFLTLLITWMALTYKPLFNVLSKTLLFSEPGGVLFSLQFLILLYLVPMTVSYAHGFRGLRWVMVAIFAGCFAVMFGFPVYAQHSC